MTRSLIDRRTTTYIDTPYSDLSPKDLLSQFPGSTSNTREHAGVVVATSGRVAVIDKGIARLMYYIWRNGIDTLESCEDVGDGMASISFMSLEDASLFLGLAIPDAEEHTSKCSHGEMTLHSSWDWWLTPNRVARRVYWEVSAAFPVTALEAMTDALFNQDAINKEAS